MIQPTQPTNRHIHVCSFLPSRFLFLACASSSTWNYHTPTLALQFPLPSVPQPGHVFSSPLDLSLKGPTAVLLVELGQFPQISHFPFTYHMASYFIHCLDCLSSAPKHGRNVSLRLSRLPYWPSHAALKTEEHVRLPPCEKTEKGKAAFKWLLYEKQVVFFKLPGPSHKHWTHKGTSFHLKECLREPFGQLSLVGSWRGHSFARPHLHLSSVQLCLRRQEKAGHLPRTWMDSTECVDSVLIDDILKERDPYENWNILSQLPVIGSLFIIFVNNLIPQSRIWVGPCSLA